MEILRANKFATYNQWAPGKIMADPEKPDSIWQINQGQSDTVSISNFFAGDTKTNQILATDSSDTINFMEDTWKEKGYQVDDQTGIGGTLYTDDKGNNVLVSGGAKVNTGTFKPEEEKTDDSSPFGKAEYSVVKDGKLDGEATADNVIKDTQGIIGGLSNDDGKLSKQEINDAIRSVEDHKDTVDHADDKLKVLNGLKDNFDGLSEDGNITKEKLGKSLNFTDGKTEIKKPENTDDSSPFGKAKYSVLKDGKLDGAATADNVVKDTLGIIGGQSDGDDALSKFEINTAISSIERNKDTVDNADEKLKVLNDLKEHFDGLSEDGNISKEKLGKSLNFTDGKTEIKE